MKLGDIYTSDQMAAAKKTVTVTTEIDGQEFVEVLDGTQGLVVMVINDNYVKGTTKASGSNMVIFGVSLLNDIAKSDPRLLLYALSSFTKHIISSSSEAEPAKEAVL